MSQYYLRREHKNNAAVYNIDPKAHGIALALYLLGFNVSLYTRLANFDLQYFKIFQALSDNC